MIEGSMSFEMAGNLFFSQKAGIAPRESGSGHEGVSSS